MSIVTAGRDQASKYLFVDSCTVTRYTVAESDGELSESGTQLYSGGCRVRPLRGSEIEVAGQETDLHMYRVLLPYNTDGVKPGDVVAVTSSTDGDLDGAELVVDSVRASSSSVARRLICRLQL